MEGSNNVLLLGRSEWAEPHTPVWLEGRGPLPRLPFGACEPSWGGPGARPQGRRPDWGEDRDWRHDLVSTQT
jgi:hypothetical protein